MIDGVVSDRKEALVIARLDTDACRVGKILRGLGLRTRHLKALGSCCDSGRSGGVVVYCDRRGDLSAGRNVPVKASDCFWIVLTDNDCEKAIAHTLRQGASHLSSLGDSDMVLQARIQASLRLWRGADPTVFSVPPYQFYLSSRAVTRDGVRISLTTMEFALAFYLFRHAGRDISRSELLRCVWCCHTHLHTRRIDTASCRVRQKLGLDGEGGWHLTHVRGKGYALRCQEV